VAAQRTSGNLYEEIAGDLRKRIRAGEFTPNATVGTLPELQKKYGAAQNTVREALKVLAREGLVITRAGKGTYVTGGTGDTRPEDDIAALRRRMDEIEVQMMEVRAVTGLAEWQPGARAEAQ
jgi:DNA-binding GntR family transcriptional regulator